MELTLDLESLRMINIGEINEGKHLSQLPPDQKSVLDDLSDEFKTSELKTLMDENGYSERILYVWLTKWQSDGQITKISQGKFLKN